MMKQRFSALATAIFLAVAPSSYAAQTFPSGASYDVAFAPSGAALNLVITGIKSAKSSVLVAAYSFTSKPIAYALIKAHQRGVKVYVIGDEQQNSKSYSAITYLANNGVPVALNGHYQSFHHKFMVIDGAHVETGSFNYSVAATKNPENILMMWNVPQLAAAYTAEWQKLWKESTPLAPRH